MNALTRLMREAAELGPDGFDSAGVDHVNEVWRHGRRRRLVRVAATAAGSLAVLAVVVSLVLGTSNVLPDQMLPASGGRGTAVTSYPQRIGHQLVVTDLPSRPGPMSGLVLREGGDEGRTWEVVSPTGRRYGLPLAAGASADIQPVMSGDGRRVSYYQPQFDRMVVHDLTTGASWLVDVGEPQRTAPSAEPQRARSIQMNQQSPGWFSPSGGQLALSTAQGPYVIEMRTDKRVLVPGMQAAGWLDEDRLVGRVIEVDPDGSLAEREVVVVVWDRRTGRTTRLGAVDLTRAPVPVHTFGQWWGAVRVDRTLWITAYNDGSRSWLGGFSLDDLSPVDFKGEGTADAWNEVESTDFGTWWMGTSPIGLVTYEGGLEVRPTSLGDSPAPAIAIERSLGVQRIVWSENALNGKPSFTLFGTSNAWWAWWWKEIALVMAGVGLLVRWRRRRRGSVAK